MTSGEQSVGLRLADVPRMPAGEGSPVGLRLAGAQLPTGEGSTVGLRLTGAQMLRNTESPEHETARSRSPPSVRSGSGGGSVSAQVDVETPRRIHGLRVESQMEVQRTASTLSLGRRC